MINFIEKNKKIINYFIPLYSGIIFYFIVNLINIVVFKINLLGSIYIIPDIIVSVFISYILFLFSKRIKIFLIIQFLFLLFLHISNSIKSSFFGAPIIFDDIVLLKETILSIVMINPLYVIIIFLIVSFLVLVLIYNFKFRKSGLFLLLFLIIFIFSLNIFPNQYNKALNVLDKSYLFWNQQENYKHNGPLIYFINQYIRSNHSSQIPNKETVEKALLYLNKNKIVSSLSNDPSQFKDKSKFDLYQNRPNIYFILVESLWDSKLLNNINFSQDVFYKDFRDIRNQSKDSFLLSPTFEGKTADPEFELLCGIPVMSNSVVFQTELKNNIECLPKILSQMGYKTNVFHPDYANFFNRTNAYKKIGFDNYFSLNNYKMDDLNEGKLADSSFLNQSYNFTRDQKQPQFNYYITLSTHIPYSLNNNRPQIIKNDLDNYWINNYSNSIYYSTKEIYNFVKEIREKDSNSIIIITGDHLPFLGMDKEVYTATKTLDEKVLHSTPLIFINNNKVENPGVINMYDFPKIILNLLGVNPSNLSIGFFNIFGVRPLYVDKTNPEYINLNIDKNILIKTLEYYKIIYNDLLFGKQYSIAK